MLAILPSILSLARPSTMRKWRAGLYWPCCAGWLFPASARQQGGIFVSLQVCLFFSFFFLSEDTAHWAL